MTFDRTMTDNPKTKKSVSAEGGQEEEQQEEKEEEDAGEIKEVGPGAVNEDSDNVIEIRLKWLQIEQVKRDRRYAILGKTGLGKSVLLEDLLSNIFFSYDHAFGMSPTPGGRKVMQRFIAPTCIFRVFDTDRLTKIIETMSILSDIQPEGAKRLILIVLDDCQADEKGFKHPIFRQISMNGRHWGVAMMFLAQYVMLIPAFFREQIDYVFALGTDSPKAITDLTKFFGSMEPREFESTIKNCTSNFGVLVADHTAKSVPTNVKKGQKIDTHKFSVENSVFFYRARPSVKAHLMGNRNHWKLHHRFYRPRHITLSPFPIPSLNPAVLEERKKKKNEGVIQRASVARPGGRKRGSSSSSKKDSGPSYEVTVLDKVDPMPPTLPLSTSATPKKPSVAASSSNSHTHFQANNVLSEIAPAVVPRKTPQIRSTHTPHYVSTPPVTKTSR